MNIERIVPSELVDPGPDNVPNLRCSWTSNEKVVKVLHSGVLGACGAVHAPDFVVVCPFESSEFEVVGIPYPEI